MLKELRITNFKCFGEQVTIPLAPITLVYGENSAGKSAVFQALRLFVNSIVSSFKIDTYHYFTHRELVIDQSPKDDITTVPFETLVHNGCIDREIVIALDKTSVDDDINSLGSGFSYHNAGGSRGFLETLEFDDKKVVIENAYVAKPAVHELQTKTRIDVTWLKEILRPHYNVLKEKRLQIASNYHKYIELLIMQDYFSDNLDVQIKVRKSAWSGLGMESEEDPTPGFVEQHCKDRHVDGLEDWIYFGIPGWAQYRDTEPYKQKKIEYQKKYAEDINFFSTEFTFDQHMLRYAGDNVCFWSPKSLNSYSIRVAPAFVRDTVLAYKLRIHLDARAVLDPLEDGFGAELELSGEGYTVHIHDGTLVDNDMFCLCLDAANVIKRMHEHEIKSRTEHPYRFVVDRLNDYFKNLLEDHVMLWSRLTSLPPLREPPKDDYAPDSGLGCLANGIRLRRYVNKWLEHLGTTYQIDYMDSKTGQGKTPFLVDVTNDHAHQVMISEAGFGFSQVLPIIIECLKDENRVIMIEEPELHIHPKLQANLGDLFCDTIKHRQHQLLIETHSEHLMLRIQRLIRKGVLSSNDVSVLYVCRNANGSSVQRLRMDDGGEFLDEWPGGFFEESFNEIFGDS